jgi:hypothetical protein
MDNANNNNPLKKRLYQNLLNKSPKQNNLLNSTNIGSKSGILKPKISEDIMNSTLKKSMSPMFTQGRFKIDTRPMKSP